MTVPVMQDSGDPMASDPPMFDDELEGGWRTRFVMPAGRTADDLPEPPDGDRTGRAARRAGSAVVSFAGRRRRPELAEQEDRLRGWLARNGEKSRGRARICVLQFAGDPGAAAPERGVAGARLKRRLQRQHRQRGLGRLAALVLLVGSARASAWASFSTVRMPLPMARPSRVSAIRPRALSPATISK